MKRPWCACGKVRLQSMKHFHTEESAKRLWLHEAETCRVWVLNRSERKEPRK